MKTIFACVKWGDAYGPEYVNILRDMVSRNLSAGTEAEFWCLTDKPEGLGPGVLAVPLPMGPDGWWAKLAMFAPGVFPTGARIIYFDLDTIICGAIDALLSIEDDFAILRDFYRPDGYGSGVMACRAGWGAHIWESWIAAGSPDLPGGDQAWIELVQPTASRLQDLFPGLFVSFKADCRPLPPKGASVVCFHGQPKPHNCGAEWARDMWKIGGSTSFTLDMVRNTANEKVLGNVRSAIARPLPWLGRKAAHDGTALIVGGAPSVRGMLRQIRGHQAQGSTVFALNGAYRMLLDAGIVPDHQVVCDARASNARFVARSRPTHLIIASQCDPIVFDVALEAERDITVFHIANEGAADILREDQTARPIEMSGRGSTVALQTMNVAFAMGFRKFHLYGVDSSYAGADGHAYAQPENDADRIIDVTLGGRSFRSAPWMVAQVEEFQQTAAELRDLDCEIAVFGDGLLPWMARLLAAPSIIRQAA